MATIGFTGVAFAHTSEQVFVLLLPTGLYASAGVAAVALTVIVLGVWPDKTGHFIGASKSLFKVPPGRIDTFTSLISLAILAMIVVTGFTGSRDPLANPLPLLIWTLWWMGFLATQALVGDLWRWVNPWTGLYSLLRGRLDAPALFVLPEKLGMLPAIAGFVAFALFMLADLAPEDPARLAVVVSLYWIYTFIAMVLFGADVWLARGEAFTIILRQLATLAAFRVRDGRLHFGAPGWQIVHAPALSITGAIMVLLILGTGSFDGVNETFWWLAQFGINPLEFPGRSAVVWPTVLGAIAADLLLIGLFATVIWLGLHLARGQDEARLPTGLAFGRLARAVLPIAFGYHVAHYLTAFLVKGQYALVAATDPWSTGADYLELGPHFVSTGFLNTRDTVEFIWLTQAGAVVAGHIVAVLVSHAIALDMFGNARKAVISQIPLALFMIAYTVFGLWLLAAPKAA